MYYSIEEFYRTAYNLLDDKNFNMVNRFIDNKDLFLDINKANIDFTKYKFLYERDNNRFNIKKFSELIIKHPKESEYLDIIFKNIDSWNYNYLINKNEKFKTYLDVYPEILPILGETRLKFKLSGNGTFNMLERLPFIKDNNNPDLYVNKVAMLLESANTFDSMTYINYKRVRESKNYRELVVNANHIRNKVSNKSKYINKPIEVISELKLEKIFPYHASISNDIEDDIFYIKNYDELEGLGLPKNKAIRITEDVNRIALIDHGNVFLLEEIIHNRELMLVIEPFIQADVLSDVFIEAIKTLYSRIIITDKNSRTEIDTVKQNKEEFRELTKSEAFNFNLKDSNGFVYIKDNKYKLIAEFVVRYKYSYTDKLYNNLDVLAINKINKSITGDCGEKPDEIIYVKNILGNSEDLDVPEFLSILNNKYNKVIFSDTIKEKYNLNEEID